MRYNKGTAKGLEVAISKALEECAPLQGTASSVVMQQAEQLAHVLTSLALTAPRTPLRRAELVARLQAFL